MSDARRNRNADLTQGSVPLHMLSLGSFIIMGSIAMMVTTLADGYFVAKLGLNELAALSFAFPVLVTMSSIGAGFATGVVVLVARAIGQGDREGARTLSTDSLLLGGLIVVVLTTLGYLTIDPLFLALGAAPDIMPLVRQYMEIWWLGMVLFIAINAGNMILRAHGNTRSPAIFQTISAIGNIILDPILIFGLGPIPGLGLQGAALAGVLSRVLWMAGIFWVLQFRMHCLAPVTLSKERLLSSWGRLLHISLPATANQLVTPLSTIVITKIVALSGTVAVAAYGAASRIEVIAMFYLLALGAVMAPVVGQNAGAGRMDRVEEAVRFATRFSIGAGLVLTVSLAIAGSTLVNQFTTNPDAAKLANFYLLVVPVSYILAGMTPVASQTLNALTRPMLGLTVGVVRTVGAIPICFLGQWLAGARGVFIGLSFSAMVAGALAWIVLRKTLQLISSQHPHPIATSNSAAS